MSPTDHADTHADVVVVGSGVIGLTTAIELTIAAIVLWLRDSPDTT